MCCRMKPPMLRMAILSLSECERLICFLFCASNSHSTVSPFFVRLLDTFVGINVLACVLCSFLCFVFIVCVIVD